MSLLLMDGPVFEAPPPPEPDARRAAFLAHVAATYDEALALGENPTFCAIVIGNVTGEGRVGLITDGGSSRVALAFSQACLGRAFSSAAD